MAQRVASRVRVRRVPSLGRYDRASIDRVLDRGLVAHITVVEHERPFCLPMLYARRDDHVLIHGSSASRLTRRLASGSLACVTVTILDGLVLARSVFEHSVNYESVMLLGQFAPIDAPADKLDALRALSDGLLPGRWDEVRPPNRRELKATRVLAMRIDEAAVKARTGPPQDATEDLDRDGWAGVIPILRAYGTPQPSSELSAVPALPPSLEQLLGRTPA
jgi:nitroimidazol reductase NimA-like FMN-containing flavoprotein (pyridoxamine 5'-phosphate oxidase superfamily)